jgi:cytochrome c oxidase cbb3-type subunit 1
MAWNVWRTWRTAPAIEPQPLLPVDASEVRA